MSQRLLRLGDGPIRRLPLVVDTSESIAGPKSTLEQCDREHDNQLGSRITGGINEGFDFRTKDCLSPQGRKATRVPPKKWDPVGEFRSDQTEVSLLKKLLPSVGEAGGGGTFILDALKEIANAKIDGEAPDLVLIVTDGKFNMLESGKEVQLTENPSPDNIFLNTIASTRRKMDPLTRFVVMVPPDLWQPGMSAAEKVDIGLIQALLKGFERDQSVRENVGILWLR
jgi:hypothetical protein